MPSAGLVFATDPAHIGAMKQFLSPFLLCCLLAAPAQTHAQDAQTNRDDGLGLMERGFRQLLDGLMQDMEPALDDMADALKELQPMARQLADLIGDARFYEAPERLENGDILIRRKPDAPPSPKRPDNAPTAEMAPDGQIEL